MRTIVLALFLMLWGFSSQFSTGAASAFAPSSLEPVLIIVAHPDDEVFIRSTIARLVENGNEVDAIYLTAGEGGTDRHWSDTPEYSLSAKEQAAHQSSLRATRTAETSRAADQYGLKHHYILGVRDEPLRDPMTHIPVRNPEPFLKAGGPWDIEKIRKQILDIADQLKPGIVITFYPSQPTTHAHHQATAKIVEQMRKDHLFGKALKAAYGFYESDVIVHRESLHYALNEKRVEVSPRWLSDQPGVHQGIAYGKIGTAGALEHDSQLKGDTSTLIRQWDKNPNEILAPLTSEDSLEPLRRALRLP